MNLVNGKNKSFLVYQIIDVCWAMWPLPLGETEMLTDLKKNPQEHVILRYLGKYKSSHVDTLEPW